MVLAWCGFAVLALFFLLYITPRKGAFFGDEGWYMYTAFRALRHGELDLFLPQAPAYLFNTAFMTILGAGYLPLRWVYTLCSMAAGVAIMTGVGGARGYNKVIIPLGLCCILVAGLSSVVNYQNGPSLFLLMGLGLYWLSRKTVQPVLFVGGQIASGLCLAFSSMVNFTVAPGLVLICLWLLYTAWRRKDVRLAVSPLSCGVFYSLMLGVYLSKLGLGELFNIPKGHGFHFERLQDILALGALVPACWALYWLIERIAGRAGATSKLQNRYAYNPASVGLFLATLVAAAYMVRFLLVMAMILPPFPLTLVPAVHPLIILPQYAYAVLCLAVFYGDWTTELQRRGVFCVAALLAYWAQQTFYSDIPVNISMVFASGYFMALGLMMLSTRTGRVGRVIISISAVFFVAGCLVHLYYGGWTTETRLTGPKVELDNPRFSGILESPERAETFTKIKQAYAEYGCKDKVLITFRNTSLIYYYLDHKAPKRLSYISQNFGMYMEEIRAILESGRPWCVFYSENVDLISNEEEERVVMELIETHAENRVVLGNDEPRHLYDDFILYTGPKSSGNRAE
ncbi:hypothetical protein [Oceanidesulfovibrio indonesiensis]|uniref:hypothetical protein n=1 Tax=Oceanidesulfovibrio indonesiensis TaxID=54767 RepID=UPI0011871C47|nr:hypothetical protein [Oceanidesulfovibrio indonesiensis]